MEITCSCCDEQFVIEYHGEDEINYCPLCGTDLYLDFHLLGYEDED